MMKQANNRGCAISCAIYKSRRKQDTYLYVATKDDFSRVPEVLLGLLGDLVPVVDLELTPERKLAQEDVLQVMEQLQKQGWYLQLPKTDFVPRSQ